MNPVVDHRIILDAFESSQATIIDLDRDLSVPSGEAKTASYSLERELTTAGLAAGDVVILSVGNGPLFPAALTAILRAEGAPLLVHGDTPPKELRRAAHRFGARHILTDSTRPDALSTLGMSTMLVGGPEWADAVWATDDTGTDLTSIEGVRGVPLHPTSGTTGEARMAARPGSSAVAEATNYIETIGIESSDSILCHIPMTHAYGYGICFMVALLTGATLYTMRRLSSPALVSALTDLPVTVYPSVPGALDLLLLSRYSEPSLPRHTTSAGAPLPERVALHCRRRWNTTVRPLYGTTETGGISVAPDDHDPTVANSVGPAMNGVATRLEPVSASSPAEIGHLWIKSPSMMTGYITGCDIDTSMVVDGWFDTGDLATIDSDGNILLKGRASETINVFGHKVLPSEVEEVIALLPGVREAKVYSSTNRWGSNWVKAAVVAEPTVSVADIEAHCEENLVSYKRPERIEMLTEMPRSKAGKIIVSQLP